MGLGLSLLPIFVPGSSKEVSNDIISLERDDDLFEFIKELANKDGVDVPRGGISSYLGEQKGFEGTCYGTTEFNKEGKRLKSLVAGELTVLFSEYVTESWQNKAVFAYVKELPPNWPIYLFWH